MKKMTLVVLGVVSLFSMVAAHAEEGNIDLIDSSLGEVSSVMGTIRGAAAEQMFTLLNQGKNVRKGLMKAGGCIPGAKVIGDVVEGKGVSCVKYRSANGTVDCMFDLDSDGEFSPVQYIVSCEQ